MRVKMFLIALFVLFALPARFLHAANCDYDTTTGMYKMVDAAVATTDGCWLKVPEVMTKTIQVKGITTATVIVNVSNSLTKPADTDHEIQADSVTADTMIVVTYPVYWIKVRVSAWTSGTISAFLKLERK